MSVKSQMFWNIWGTVISEYPQEMNSCLCEWHQNLKSWPSMMVDRKAELSGFTEGYVVLHRSTEVLCFSLEAGMLSWIKVGAICSQSSEARGVGAQPELWSITSEITIAVTNLDSMKEKERQRVTKSQQNHTTIYIYIYLFFSFSSQNILYDSHNLTQAQVNLKQKMSLCG